MRKFLSSFFKKISEKIREKEHQVATLEEKKGNLQRPSKIQKDT